MTGSIAPLFSDYERTDSSPAGHSESQSRFLDRVAGTYWDSVRALLEDWYLRVGSEAQPDLRARLRSPDDHPFESAFWELYLHESLLRAGYTVQAHPEIEGTHRRPDFLASRDEGSFYLEARVTSKARSEVAREARRRDVYDSLDRVYSPNFFLWLSERSLGSAPLRTKELRKALESWLQDLDPDALERQLADQPNIRALPSFSWNCDGWELEFSPIPKSRDARGLEGIRPLGAFGSGSGDLSEEARVRKALEDKGSAYGELGLPYIVALRVERVVGDDFAVANALYGTLQMRLSTVSDKPASYVRTNDGYWYKGTRWAHSVTSAVLVAYNLSPLNVTSVVPTLWTHPDPQHRAPVLDWWRVAEPQEGILGYREPKRPLNEAFGLPVTWPPGKPFND